MSTGRTNLPAIRESSPLAEGLTVNLLRERRGTWRLRVWFEGVPVEDTTHMEASAALRRLVELAVSRLGADNAIRAAVGRFIMDEIGRKL